MTTLRVAIRGVAAAAIVLLWTAPLRAQALPDTVVIGVGGELSAPLYQELMVPVFADLRKVGTEKLGSYTVRVSWNPNVLSFVGGGGGSFGTPVVRQDSTSFGVVWVAGISPTGAGGVVDLFSLNLSPYGTAADTIRLQVTELSAAGTFRDLMTTTEVVVKSGAYCAALGAWGDLDADGFANSRDALAILSNIVGLPVGGGFDLTLGDVDGDALVNSRDALILLSYAVGLPIPGQRVLLVAGGSCTTGQVPQVTILPDTADLVVNQQVEVLGIARDATGALVTITGGSLESADPRIAVVSDGIITGRTPGTTVVTGALGPGVRVDIPVVVRARRGTWRVDAAKAKLGTVQLGTQRWPFATPEYAFPLVSEGDTIRVAPGIVDYEGASCYFGCTYPTSNLYAGIVLIGDTLPDGTRPILRAAEGSYLEALPWYGGVHGEVQHLAFQGFYQLTYLAGLRSLLVNNVRFEEPRTVYGYGIYANSFVDTVRIHRSEFLADTTGYQSYGGLYLNNGASYVEVLDSRFWYWGDGGIYAVKVDSLDVFRSEFSYGDYAGIYVNDYDGHALNARISQSRFLDNYYEAVRITGARRVALDQNYIYQRDDDGIDITGVTTSAGRAQSGTRVTMSGDSIKFRGASWNWIYLNDLDSVVIDNLWLASSADTALNQYAWIGSNYARLTNSKLLNLYYEGFDYGGRELVVDNTDFTGCAVAPCGWAAGTAIRAYADNDSGPRVRLTNSSFTGMYRALEAGYANTKAGPYVVTGNVVDSVAYAFYLRGDSIAFTDDTLSRIRDYALDAQPGYSNRPFIEADISRNRVMCSLAGTNSQGLRSDNGPVRFENNYVRNCRYGLYTYNYSYPLATVTFRGDTVLNDSTGYYRVGIRADGKWQPVIARNRIVGGYYGIDLELNDTLPTVIDTNAVSGTGYAGIYLYYLNGPVTGLRNNIGGNATYGMLNYGTGSRSFTLGRFVGNLNRAVYNGAAVTFGATQNWWGNADFGLAADTVQGLVDVSGWLTTDPTDVPAFAPRFVMLAGAAPSPADATAVAPRPAPSAPAAPPAEHDHGPERQARRAAKDAARAARRPAEVPRQ